MADKDSCLDERRRRLVFRAWRRGFREADLVLGPFAEQAAPTMDADDVAAFEALLNHDDDHAIYAWIIGSAPTPPLHNGPLMARIRAFMRDHVAAAVAEGAG